MRVNERIHTFYGLNNLLDPASAEYREGMAFECTNARINNKGLWAGGLSSQATTTGATAITLSGGTGQRQMTVNGTTRVATAIGIAAEGQNGYIYYIDSGALKRYKTLASTVLLSDVAAPTLSSAAAAAVGSISRMVDGFYYYIITKYDDTYKRESLPSTAFEVSLDTSGSNTGVTLTFGSGTYRIYRSKRTDTANQIYNAPNRFYFVDEITGTSYDDIRGDDELLIEYEGRGSVMTDANFIVQYNDRMLYFKGNDLWWSSSGRPEEVAQKFSVTFKDSGSSTTKTVSTYPKLANGYGEAKKTIPELAGATITGAMEKDGKLWLFTNAMIGYLSEAYGGEGYIFKVWRRGVGVINQHCLQSCEYGIFGFDGQGMWLLNNSGSIKRLTENRVDLSSFYSGSAFYGIWCPNMNEYLMCNCAVAVAYQADKDIFAGPYTLTNTAGCSYYGGTGAWGLSGGATNAMMPNTGSTFTLKFYLGQTSPTTIKQRICVEAVKTDATSTMTIKVGAGAAKAGITSESSAESSTAYSVRQTTSNIGRMIYAEIGMGAGAGLSTLNYRYDPIEWSEADGR